MKLLFDRLIRTYMTHLGLMNVYCLLRGECAFAQLRKLISHSFVHNRHLPYEENMNIFSLANISAVTETQYDAVIEISNSGGKTFLKMHKSLERIINQYAQWTRLVSGKKAADELTAALTLQLNTAGKIRGWITNFQIAVQKEFEKTKFTDSLRCNVM